LQSPQVGGTFRGTLIFTGRDMRLGERARKTLNPQDAGCILGKSALATRRCKQSSGKLKMARRFRAIREGLRCVKRGFSTASTWR
jgi:hypothetical protein